MLDIRQRLKERDVQIGLLIKQARRLRGLSRKQLADQVGITHQQILKYEKATDRVSASRLEAIADVLRQPLTYFYEEKPYKERDVSSERVFMEIFRKLQEIRSARDLQLVEGLVRSIAEKYALMQKFPSKKA